MQLRRAPIGMAIAALAFGIGTAEVGAAVYLFTVDQPNSSAATTANVSAPLSGTLIGNYNAKTNPAGTMTRPGLFGGSGNVAIAYTGTVTGGGPSQSNPTGTYALDVDTSANTVAMANVAIDALAGTQPAFPATFNVLYSTFRTLQPDSTFFGGVTLPIPLGELVVTSLTITQSPGSASGLLTKTSPNAYTYSAVVEATVALEGQLNGSPVVQQQLALLNITGTLTIVGNTAASAMTIHWNVNQTDNGPFDPIVGVPLDVPTIFPSGQTAHLLVDGQIQSIATQLELEVEIVATGSGSVTGDITGDGVVDVSDLLAVLNAWGICPSAAGQQLCPADVAPLPNGDGVVNVSDLLLIINHWG